MTELPRTAKRYLNAVRRHLDAPQEDRARLMERLNRAVSTYLVENEGNGPIDFTTAFGQPEVCASNLLSEIDPLEVAAARNRRKRKQWTVLGILMALVILLASVSLYLYSTGGLVIITQGTYADPGDAPPPSESDSVTFHYEYENGD